MNDSRVEPVPSGNGRRGSIMPVGGAEEKIRDTEILRHFVELSGGDGARIVVIPTASRAKETGESYLSLFRKLGASDGSVLPIKSRADCSRREWIREIESADGVFLTGGNQLRLSTTIGGTPVAFALRRMNRRGMVVAGTSAGAAFMSEHMIAFGEEGASPRADMVTLAPGLGLLDNVIIDQHFRERDRLGRLLAALAFNPNGIGVGLDEDTAAVIGPDNVLRVLGSGAITIVDPADLEFSSMDSAQEHSPVCLIGIKIHVLIADSTFDLTTRVAAPPPHL
ncbi:MAG: cyanophycinase [Gemmatimonadota bacterium]